MLHHLSKESPAQCSVAGSEQQMNRGAGSDEHLVCGGPMGRINVIRSHYIQSQVSLLPRSYWPPPVGLHRERREGNMQGR